MQTLTKTCTGAKIVIETLKQLGVDTIFGYPGGIVLSVYDELAQQSDILPEEGEHPVLPLQPGGDLRGVAPAHLVHGQVGGDHGAPLPHQPGVDESVESRLDKGGSKLTAQVVQDEQIAV